ncbi:MAG: CDP-alcohol phosphatidyltransferase family protein [Paracoccus sp. (in: a-proteobacteria)]
MTQPHDRRPIASRNTGWARRLSIWLASTPITPNQISLASIAAALVAGGAFWAVGSADGGGRVALLVLAALGCQVRLICNLMDGLVAIEAGRQAPDGPFWNEFPDRIADIAILAGLGLGLGLPALGWAAAALAVLTAYTRELGRSCGLAADFSGPMAKPQRMALVTAGALIAVLEPLWSAGNTVLWITLWLVMLGTALTVARRAWRIVSALNAG